MVLVISFVVMTIAIFAQVVNRNIFKIPVSGFEEVAKYCMIYMVMLGTELGLRDGTQIAVTSVIDKFHGVNRRVCYIVAKVIVILFSGVMFLSGVSMVSKQAQTGQTTPGLGLPMTVPYFSLVLGFGLIIVIQIVLVIQMIRDLEKPEEAITEEREDTK